MAQDQTSMLLQSASKRPVRLSITIDEQKQQASQPQPKQQPKEKVLSVDSDGWETVEVSGFVFKRRRTQPTPAPTTPPTPPLSISPANLETLLAACATACAPGPSSVGPEFARRMQAAVEARLKPCVQESAGGLGARLTAKALLHELTARKALLQGRLTQQQAEAREWEALINSTQQLQQDVQRALAEGNAQPADDDCTARDACAGQLRAAQEALQQALTVQAEGLCAAVDKSRALLEGAEHCCHEIQNKYHHEKFKPFSDMDAPAALIKKLTTQP